MTDTELTADERDLLLWLAKEDFSQYGECHGRTLDALIEKGLAQMHGPGEHQVFIAKDLDGAKAVMYRAVSLTARGMAEARIERGMGS